MENVLKYVLGILLSIIGAAFLLFGILGFVSSIALRESYILEPASLIVLFFVIAFGGIFSFFGIRFLKPKHRLNKKYT